MSNVIEFNTQERREGAVLLAKDKALLCERRHLQPSSGCRGYALSDFGIDAQRLQAPEADSEGGELD